jgi:hypothetical protein
MEQYQGIVESLAGDTFALRTTGEHGQPKTIAARIHASCDAPELQNGMMVLVRGEWPAIIGQPIEPSFSVREISIVLDHAGE